MSEKMTIELDVVATALVCRLKDGRLAVMHDTEKGGMGPKLHAIMGEDCADVQIGQAATAVLNAAAAPKKKRPSLKRDKDAKDAMVALVESTPEPLTDEQIRSNLGLTTKRVSRLLNSICEEDEPRITPTGEGTWTIL